MESIFHETLVAIMEQSLGQKKITIPSGQEEPEH